MQYSLRELRVRNNYTQAKMADLLGISRQRYNEIEKNPSKTSMSRMQQIAKILKVEIGDIFLTDYLTNSEVK